MKILITTLSVCATMFTVAAHAASWDGQCVSPQTKPGANGRLQFKNPIDIYAGPDKSAESVPLKQLLAFTVTREKNGFIQLVFTEGTDSTPDPRAGKIAGWAKKSDFRLQDLRNCN